MYCSEENTDSVRGRGEERGSTTTVAVSSALETKGARHSTKKTGQIEAIAGVDVNKLENVQSNARLKRDDQIPQCTNLGEIIRTIWYSYSYPQSSVYFRPEW